MKNLIGIILLCTLTYYGVKYHDYMNQPTVKVEERLVPFVNEWIDMMDEERVDYVNSFSKIKLIAIVEDSVVLHHMRLYNLKGHAVAISDPVTQMILISETQASKGDHTLRATLWHELGHHIFAIDHVKGYYIMNEYTFSEEEFKEDWAKLRLDYLLMVHKHEVYAKY